MKKNIMKIIISTMLFVAIIFTLTGCKEDKHLNSFLNDLNDSTRSYILTITVNKDGNEIINKLECANNVGYAYTKINEVKSNEFYFTNALSDSPKTYKKISDEWKNISNSNDYESFFGNRFLVNLELKKEEEYYGIKIQSAEFKIYPEEHKILVTNVNTQDTVIFDYDFTKEPTIVLPF